MAKAEVTEMDGGCTVLSQGGAVSHMPCFLWRRAVTVHLWPGFIFCSKLLQLKVYLRRGVPLVAEDLVDCGASQELASLHILHPGSLQHLLSDS